jgi:hypothetical protein
VIDWLNIPTYAFKVNKYTLVSELELNVIDWLHFKHAHASKSKTSWLIWNAVSVMLLSP